jgi:hypothetical protein
VPLAREQHPVERGRAREAARITLAALAREVAEALGPARGGVAALRACEALHHVAGVVGEDARGAEQVELAARFARELGEGARLARELGVDAGFELGHARAVAVALAGDEAAAEH